MENSGFLLVQYWCIVVCVFLGILLRIFCKGVGGGGLE